MKVFIQDWNSLLQIFVTTIIIYPLLIVFLRVSGKRTLAKWNAFDFVATIALGSTFATVILSKDVVVLDGVLALILIISLQYLITWLSVRMSWVENIVKSKPSLLYFNDAFQLDQMKKRRVSKSEILSAIRSSTICDMDLVLAVVLETDGSFSVLRKENSSSKNSSLQNVVGANNN